MKTDLVMKGHRLGLRLRAPIALIVSMVSISASGEAVAGMQVYDSANRLVLTEDGRTTTRYRYDGTGGLVAVCASEDGRTETCWDTPLDESGGHARVIGKLNGGTDAGVHYVHGPEGLVAQRAQLAGQPPSSLYFALSDEQGTVRGLTSDDGALVGRAAYDAYGGVRTRSGPVSSDFGFHGELTAPDGNVWLRARTYSPQTGRFLQRDEFGGLAEDPRSQNRYAFANDNPAVYADPSGHIAVVPLAFAAAFLGGAALQTYGLFNRDAAAVELGTTLMDIGGNMPARMGRDLPGPTRQIPSFDAPGEAHMSHVRGPLAKHGHNELIWRSWNFAGAGLPEGTILAQRGRPAGVTALDNYNRKVKQEYGQQAFLYKPMGWKTQDTMQKEFLGKKFVRDGGRIVGLGDEAIVGLSDADMGALILPDGRLVSDAYVENVFNVRANWAYELDVHQHGHHANGWLKRVAPGAPYFVDPVLIMRKTGGVFMPIGEGPMLASTLSYLNRSESLRLMMSVLTLSH